MIQIRFTHACKKASANTQSTGIPADKTHKSEFRAVGRGLAVSVHSPRRGTDVLEVSSLFRRRVAKDVRVRHLGIAGHEGRYCLSLRCGETRHQILPLGTAPQADGIA